MSIVPATLPSAFTSKYRHVALTISGSTHTLYLDGTQVGINLSGGNMLTYGSAIPKIYIGCAGDLSYGFTGIIDDFKIWNRALPLADINYIYLADKKYPAELYGITPYSGNLINYFKFNETNGTTSITDLSGGVISKVYANAVINTCTFSSGQLNNCINLGSNTQNGYLKLPATVFYNTNLNYTISFWIYLTTYTVAADHFPTIFARQLDNVGTFIITANVSWPIQTYKNNGILFHYNEKLSNTPIPLNTWTHYALTVNGSNAKGYINGIIDITYNSFPNNLTVTDTLSAIIGIGTLVLSNNGNGIQSQHADGVSLDDFSIWNTALPASAVYDLYSSQNV